jgi:spermidine synthase
VEQRKQLLIYGLFIASGATALVYEVTWLRNLSLIFGASFHATSIVLASYMAGLSLGGFVAGLLSTRIRRALRVYGRLEIGIAACALVLPTLLRGVDAVYVEAASRAQDLETALTLMRAVMAFGVLVVPTFLMGATLPVLIAGLVRREAQFGVRLSWLYGANTVGAALGTIAAGFLLVPTLGVWRTQLCAVGINLLIGVVAIAVGSRPVRVDDDASQPHAADGPARPSGSVAFAEQSILRLVFWGTAVSGFCALALEVLWTRALSIAVGTTAYSFTVMLAAFLVGISLGSWLHALFPLRRIRVGGQFGVVLLSAGLGSLVASTWIPRLPEFAIRLNLGLYDDLSRIRPGTTLILAFLVMLIPCIFIGIAFPLANQARAALSRGYGRPVGETLGLNTLGSIGGSLVAGFLLIPLLGIQRSMLLVSALYLAYGAVVLGALATLRLPRWRWATLAATTGFALCALSVPYAARPWESRCWVTFAAMSWGGSWTPRDAWISRPRSGTRRSNTTAREGSRRFLCRSRRAIAT